MWHDVATLMAAREFNKVASGEYYRAGSHIASHQAIPLSDGVRLLGYSVMIDASSGWASLVNDGRPWSQ